MEKLRGESKTAYERSLHLPLTLADWLMFCVFLTIKEARRYIVTTAQNTSLNNYKW